MVDLKSQYLRIKPEIDRAIQHVIDSASFIQGNDVKEFASALETYLGVASVIPCANGTDALQIAMMALGFKPGDEVILPVHTYVATAEVMALLQLKPVFVDVDENTFNIDPLLIEEKITSKTVAIVPVHLYGQCADMEPILDVAGRHNLLVIEDAAQALGAEYTFSDGTKTKAGTMGTIGTTSFFPSKNLGCYGDGGALLTNSSELEERIRMIANHGQRFKYRHEIIGVNSRLDSLQAAILNVKLKYLGEYAQKRNDVAEFYDLELSKIGEVSTPFRSPNSTHVFHQYTLRVPESDRENLKIHLAGNGVPSMIYYPIPLHLQEAYTQNEFGLGSFPVTEKLSNTVISLPIHTEMSTDQLEHICRSMQTYF